MPDNFRLRPNRIARPKKIPELTTGTIVVKVVDPVNMIPVLVIHLKWIIRFF